jgi:hypothetical protein
MATSQPAPGPLFDVSEPWQMSYGERAALVGLVADLRPDVAIEIGTAEGGSLRRLARHAGHVHSFDLSEPDPALRELDNVTFHVGDSHSLLPQVLAQLAQEGVNVGFVLVDGDHSADGVARDMRDLLGSPAIARTGIAIHDTMNPEVRRGLESVEYDGWPKVRHVELDCVAGQHFREELEGGSLWGGLGLVIVDVDAPRPHGQPARQQRYHDTHGQILLARQAAAPAPAPAPAPASPARAGGLLGRVKARLAK